MTPFASVRLGGGEVRRYPFRSRFRYGSHMFLASTPRTEPSELATQDDWILGKRQSLPVARLLAIHTETNLWDRRFSRFDIRRDLQHSKKRQMQSARSHRDKDSQFQRWPKPQSLDQTYLILERKLELLPPKVHRSKRSFGFLICFYVDGDRGGFGLTLILTSTKLALAKYSRVFFPLTRNICCFPAGSTLSFVMTSSVANVNSKAVGSCEFGLSDASPNGSPSVISGGLSQVITCSSSGLAFQMRRCTSGVHVACVFLTTKRIWERWWQNRLSWTVGARFKFGSQFERYILFDASP